MIGLQKNLNLILPLDNSSPYIIHVKGRHLYGNTCLLSLLFFSQPHNHQLLDVQPSNTNPPNSSLTLVQTLTSSLHHQSPSFHFYSSQIHLPGCCQNNINRNTQLFCLKSFYVHLFNIYLLRTRTCVSWIFQESRIDEITELN